MFSSRLPRQYRLVQVKRVNSKSEIVPFKKIFNSWQECIERKNYAELESIQSSEKALYKCIDHSSLVKLLSKQKEKK